MIKYLFQFCFVFVISFHLKAQTNSNIYHPKNNDSLFLYFDRITSNRINLLDGKYKSKKKKIYKNHLKQIKNQVNDSTFVFLPSITSKINIVLHNIYKANPSIKHQDYYFLINKSIYPNAAAYGDGSFVINLGLFNFLTSDDELAFILCHEMAHLLNNDGNKSISNYIEKVNSKETKSKIRKISKQRYGKTRSGLAFIKDFSFNIFKYSRNVEMNADDLGFQLFSNTNYNKKAAITALSKLGELEKIIFNKKFDFKKFFNYPSFPFKEEWIVPKTSMFSSNKNLDDYKFDKDSLRSHPHAKERVLELLNKYKIDTLLNNYNTKTIKSVQPEVHKTLLQTLFDKKRYDLIFYLSLNKIQNNIGTEIDYNFVAKSLQAIYYDKKNHRLGKYIPQVSAFSDEKYLNQIKQFIHNIELGEIKKITRLFCTKYEGKINKKLSKKIINKLNNKQ